MAVECPAEHALLLPPWAAGRAPAPETPRASPRDSCTPEQLSSRCGEEEELPRDPAAAQNGAPNLGLASTRTPSPEPRQRSPRAPNNSSACSDRASSEAASVTMASGSWCKRYSRTNQDGSIVVSTPWYPGGAQKAHLRLSAEMADFHAFVFPNERERAVRLALRCAVQDAAARLWPHSTVKVIGSMATDFCTFESATDLVVEHCGAEQLDRLAEELTAADPRAQVLAFDCESVASARLEFSAGGQRAVVTFSEGRSEGRKTAALVRSQLTKYPAALPVAAVVRTVLAQVRCHDPSGGGLSSYAQQIMVFHCCARSAYLDDPSMVLREFFVYFANFNFGECAIDPFESQGVPKTEAEQGHAVCVRDPLSPSNNLAAACTRLLQIQQQFKYCAQALGKWGLGGGAKRGYKGRTPLSTIVSLQPLWGR
eukprot:TRINITY_DN21704_c0_g1_i1.p2 TRINITY_DN21704_c0_g1~~TRINITY_DN21704_c0_g1_i1.p2  ORF type:complete len:471 (+),score=109.90 TRINITY_DN21704_c0_g1_i1:137-1414(+)